VVRGFFVELVQQIGVPEIEDRLLREIEDELETSMGAAGQLAEVAR
jgi:Fe-S cluster assembly protein SufD